MGIEPVEFTLQLSAGQTSQIAAKVPVDVAWMSFVFDKRPIDEYLLDPNLLKLTGHDCQVLHQRQPPAAIPAR